MKAWRVAIAGALCLMLAACVTPDRIGGSGRADEFSRVGRFALTVTEPDGKQDAVQGGFSWLDEGNRYVLDLTNPLGSTQARVEGTARGATLTRANGEVLQADDPDALAEDALGSPVPVSGMRDWLRGRTARQPAATQLQSDAQNRPTSFQQGGWQANLSRYDAQGPQLLVLERRVDGRRVVVRLVVNAP